MSPAGMICARCDQAIRSSQYETITGDSASGARPDQYAHQPGGSRCASNAPTMSGLGTGGAQSAPLGVNDAGSGGGRS